MSKNSILKLKAFPASILEKHADQISYFIPLFPGIFIDLNTSVPVNDYDVLIGAEDLGTQFYFHQECLSKIFIELIPAKKIQHIDKLIGYKISDIISDKNTEGGYLKAIAYPDKRSKNPELANALICPDLEFALLFFESVEELGNVEEVMTSEMICFVKVSERITIVIESETLELYCIFIQDPLANFWHQKVVLSETELGKERMRSLKKLTYNSFNLDLSKDSFLTSITTHQKRFQESEIGNDLAKAESEILENLKNSFISDKALFGKKK